MNKQYFQTQKLSNKFARQFIFKEIVHTSKDISHAPFSLSTSCQVNNNLKTPKKNIIEKKPKLPHVRGNVPNQHEQRDKMIGS